MIFNKNIVLLPLNVSHRFICKQSKMNFRTFLLFDFLCLDSSNHLDPRSTSVLSNQSFHLIWTKVVDLFVAQYLLV